MRLIKFRVWDKWHSEMCEVSNVFWLDHGRLRVEAHGVTGTPYRNIYPPCKDFSSDGSDLLQFTGLTDKNGREIYEGDIVSSPTMRGTVVWTDSGSWGIHGYKTKEDWAPCEVIGNIYENPELLK